MENVSVILIDERDDYRASLEIFLKQHDITVLGSFNHKQFMNQKGLKPVPDIAIVSFEMPRFNTDLNVMDMQRRYPSIKILINSSDDSPAAVEKVNALGVSGLIFKNGTAFGQILLAVDALHNGRTYFSKR